MPSSYQAPAKLDARLVLIGPKPRFEAQKAGGLNMSKRPGVEITVTHREDSPN
jgi:hypothetical protein